MDKMKEGMQCLGVKWSLRNTSEIVEYWYEVLLGIKYWIEREQTELKYEPSAEEKAAGIAQFSLVDVYKRQLMDLWAQMYLLDRGERLCKYISHYRDNYFKPGRRNGHIVYSYDISKENQERIHSKIGDICMSMKAKDYLDLPERIDNIVEIQMPPEIQKAYDSFEEEQVLSMIASPTLSHISVRYWV